MDEETQAAHVKSFAAVISGRKTTLGRPVFGSMTSIRPVDPSKFATCPRTASFTNVAPEFKYLVDNNGLITMPLEIRGKVPNISVMPDINYVVQKLIISKGQEFLNRLLKNR